MDAERWRRVEEPEGDQPIKEDSDLPIGTRPRPSSDIVLYEVQRSLSGAE